MNVGKVRTVCRFSGIWRRDLGQDVSIRDAMGSNRGLRTSSFLAPLVVERPVEVFGGPLFVCVQSWGIDRG